MRMCEGNRRGVYIYNKVEIMFFFFLLLFISLYIFIGL